MPILQIHQLKVAAVAKIVCDSISDFRETVDARFVSKMLLYSICK